MADKLGSARPLQEHDLPLVLADPSFVCLLPEEGEPTLLTDALPGDQAAALIAAVTTGFAFFDGNDVAAVYERLVAPSGSLAVEIAGTGRVYALGIGAER
jgi:hypothetical protein